MSLKSPGSSSSDWKHCALVRRWKSGPKTMINTIKEHAIVKRGLQLHHTARRPLPHHKTVFSNPTRPHSPYAECARLHGSPPLSPSPPASILNHNIAHWHALLRERADMMTSIHPLSTFFMERGPFFWQRKWLQAKADNRTHFGEKGCKGKKPCRRGGNQSENINASSPPQDGSIPTRRIPTHRL
jgi:hypothetical protein